MKKIVLTVKEFLLLKKVQDVASFAYNEPDDFIEENSDKAEFSKNPEEEMPELELETEIFDDITDSIDSYVSVMEEGEEKNEAQKLLVRFENVDENN
ncbi:MAG: hypothetical protein WCX46_03050 [Candidatus Paceibacterota bacterium]